MITSGLKFLIATPPQELKECISHNLYTKSSTIEALGDDIFEKFKIEIEEERYLHRKYKGLELTKEEVSKFVAGRLFEMLILEDYKNSELQKIGNDSQKLETFHERMKLSGILCKIARYPKEYGFEIDERSSIPDGVMVHITKEGNFIITGLVEAKLGKLDKRGLNQIRLSGSRTTISNIAKQINMKLEEHLPEMEPIAQILGEHKLLTKSVNVKDKEKIMDLILVIPQRPLQGGDKYSVGFKEQNSATEYSDIRNVQKIHEQLSQFTPDDVWNMTKVIVEKIK